MRISTSLGERKPAVKKEVNSIVFLAFEGVKTEPLYFDEISRRRKELGFCEDYVLKNIKRGCYETGVSNPKKILEIIFNELENAALEFYELNNICDSLISNMFDCYSLPKKYYKDYFDKLLESLKEFMPQDVVNKEDIIQNSSKIGNALTKIFDESLVEFDIIKVIEESNFTYNEEIDYICLIVDRDKNSFTSKQYRYVKSKCEIANFKFYVTNPCFEFWLMLHFSNCDDIDKEKIKQNKVNHKLEKNFCEIELDKLIPDEYNKNCFRVDTCVDKLDIAIKNSKRYETNIDLLKDNVGSNLFELFEFLRNDND